MANSDIDLLCRQAELYYYAFLDGNDCEPISESIIKHVENCKYCQQQINQLEETLSNAESCEIEKEQIGTINKTLELHFAYIGKSVTCSSVRPFLPGLLDTAQDISVPTPITVHLDNCLQCREDLEMLRVFDLSSEQLKSLSQLFAEKPSEDTIAETDKVQELYSVIAERPDSPVATIYRIDRSAKAISETKELYADFPIKVEIAGQKELPKAGSSTGIIDFTSAVKRKALAMNPKTLLKTAVMAAAVILVAAILLLDTPTADAVTARQVYKAVMRSENIHISQFASDETVLLSERWVSKTLNLYMTRAGNTYVLCDIASGVKKKIDTDTEAVETVLLTEGELAYSEKAISGSLNFMPFSDLSQIPDDTKWDRVTGEVLEAAAENIEVYDLVWAENENNGQAISNKWRFFVDPLTNLPQRIECYRELSSEDIPETVIVIRYLSDNEMRSIFSSLR